MVMKHSGYLLDIIIVLLAIIAVDSNPSFIHVACGMLALALIGGRIFSAVRSMRR
jgi:hypothetical protein